MDTKALIGRTRGLFGDDIVNNTKAIDDGVTGARVLIIGGAGSIGREVATLVFARSPAALHIIDISENNLVELVRNLRSGSEDRGGDLRFLPLDIASIEARAFLDDQRPYDLILNFAAMKHVRSEKDAYSLMRMIKVNILDTLETLERASRSGAHKYFAVSTDKAQNPANLMGATKRIMEDVVFSRSGATSVSTARFANVAFSDGSLLHGFRQRLLLRQPLSAPHDVQRYFVTGEEAGLLCLASIGLGDDREIFFPRLDAALDLLSFADIAVRFLEDNGFTPVIVDSEAEARARAAELIAERRWPCHFFNSDTSGEKPFEEFYAPDDDIAWDRFIDIGVIARAPLEAVAVRRADDFIAAVERLRAAGAWHKTHLVDLIETACPDLAHVETGRTLDNRM